MCYVFFRHSYAVIFKIKFVERRFLDFCYASQETVIAIFPPSGVYFMALVIIFTNACCILILSPITSSCSTSKKPYTQIVMHLCRLRSDHIKNIHKSSDNLNSSSLRFILPDSIFDMSSTSFISPSRCLPDEDILLTNKQFFLYHQDYLMQ